MPAKRIILRQLMKSLGDAYWNATLRQRLYRLKLMLPASTRFDYQFEAD